MAPSWTVIKVKYGDAIRRFNAVIHKEDLSYDIIMLRWKICSLFDLTPDADFTLTYIDEDGDAVTLCDDADLHEVAAQSLDSLRITVRLNTNRCPGTSTPFDISRDLENMKCELGPMYDILSKLLLDLVPTPLFANLVEKLKMDCLNNSSKPQAGSGSTTYSGTTPEDPMGSSDNKEQQCLKIAGASKGLPDTNLEALTMKDHNLSGDPEFGSPDSKNKTVQLETVTKDVRFGYVHPPKSVDLDIGSRDIDAECGTIMAPGAEIFMNKDTVSAVKITKDNDNISIGSPDRLHQESVGFGATKPDFLKHLLEDSMVTGRIKATNDSIRSSFCQPGLLSLINECPFKGIPLSSDSTVNACPYASRVPPFKESYDHGNSSGLITHMGIYCNACGVTPITGPRFKSKILYDYDLCSICFEELGVGDDYTRMEHPVNSCNSRPLNGKHHGNGSGLVTHMGIECDVCGVIPITGPRFKSKVKYNYDLCSICFKDFGVDDDYTRMDHPVSGALKGKHYHVDDTLKDASDTSIYLNMSPVCIDPEAPEVVESKVDQDSDLRENHFIGVSESGDQFFDARPHRDQEMNSPVNELSLTSYDSMSTPKPAPNPDQEATLLKKLEDMGFTNKELNKFVLRMNNYNLEESVIDMNKSVLCMNN